MTCYGQSHMWARSSSTSNLPGIEDDEKCDCGLYTWGECRYYEQRIAALERDLAASQARIAAMETLCNKRYRKFGDERQCQFCRWFNGIHQERCPVSVYDATLTAPDSGVAEKGELSR